MMNKYGLVAVEATKLCKRDKIASPRAAWEQAVTKIFDTPSSRAKGCPRDTFLSLCEEGMVVGIPSGNYTRSVKNKQYALHAVALLQQDAELADDPAQLWKIVMAGRPKEPNQQMEVVVALWKKGLIG